MYMFRVNFFFFVGWAEFILLTVGMLSSTCFFHVCKINNCPDNEMIHIQFQKFPAGVNIRQ